MIFTENSTKISPNTFKTQITINYYLKSQFFPDQLYIF